MRSMIKLPRQLSLLLGVLLLGMLSPGFAQYGGDPSGRVARLSDSAGSVSYSPAGESDWVRATRNRPLISGDRLWTDRRARAELQVGRSALRLDQYSGLSILGLDDQFAQFELTQGSLNLRVRGVYEAQEYEIATPELALAISERGRYRVDVDPRQGITTVVIWEGSATAYGERSSFPLYAGEAVRFYDAALRDYEIFSVPRADDFDRYSLARDARLERSLSLRYVDDDLIGYADLDDYGYWRTVSGYGPVWYPERVDRDWAPYRDGHWAWQEPWGWTWVDDAPWGFAPSHYGRWAWIGGRWGWTPGPRGQRAVYAPALVAFVGGNNWSLSVSSGSGPIGWFPLGPRDVYVPSYRASRDYFNRVNVHNSSVSITVVGSAYRGYASGRPNLSQIRYANRGIAGALTVVPADVFTSARQVRGSNLQLARDDSARAEVMHMARVAPTRNSLVGSPAVTAGRPGKDVFSREVIARTPPQPGLQSFESRARSLQRNPGQPMEPAQVSGKPARGRAAEETQRVRVIGTQPGAVETRGSNDRARGALDRQVERSATERARATPDRSRPDGGASGTDTPTSRQSPDRARAEQQRVDAQQRVQAAEQARIDEARAQQLQQESRQRVEQNARDQMQERQREQNEQSQRQREAEAMQQQARVQREQAQQQQARVQREAEQQQAQAERAAAQRQQQEQARAQREAEQQERLRAEQERVDRVQQERMQAEQRANRASDDGGSGREERVERVARPERESRERQQDESESQEETDKPDRRRERED